MIYSTDHNLNKPLKVDELYASRYGETLGCPPVQIITAEEYQLIQRHDPYTIYAVHSEKTGETLLYYGDIHIQIKKENEAEYLIGPGENDTYWLYKKIVIHYREELVPIAHYKHLQQAVKAMEIYNKTGGHTDRDMNITRMVKSFVDKEITTHNLLLGLIAEEGFGDDPKFQGLQYLLYAYNNDPAMGKASSYDLPIPLKHELPYLKRKFPDSLISLYSDLFDAIVPFIPDLTGSNHDHFDFAGLVRALRIILET